MEKANEEKNKFVCYDCFKLKACKESPASWILFFIAIVAVISLRAVNVAMDVNPLLAKVFWYLGVCGFLVFFIFKYRYHNAMQKELNRTNLADKVLNRQNLADGDYDVLGTVLCKLRSKKDKINYLFIFVFSAIALILAIYADFFK